MKKGESIRTLSSPLTFKLISDDFKNIFLLLCSSRKHEMFINDIINIFIKTKKLFVLILNFS